MAFSYERGTPVLFVDCAVFFLGGGSCQRKKIAWQKVGGIVPSGEARGREADPRLVKLVKLVEGKRQAQDRYPCDPSARAYDL